MKYALVTTFTLSALLGTTAAMAQVGAPCSNPGATYNIGGKQYICSPAAGQARNPNWDGRSRERTQPVGLPQPRGASTQQVVFPGLANDQYRKLQNSAKGRELIQQADNLRAQKAEAQRQFDNAARARNAEQLQAANRRLEAINRNLNGMQRKAQQVLVELR